MTSFSRQFASPEHAEAVRVLPTPFQMFRYMTGSEHLHFGLFLSPDDDFAVAQDRNMQHLLRWIPVDAAKVLDVGCGIGGTSVTLAERGHHVTAFAPDQPLIDYGRALAAQRGVAARCQFFRATLQDVPGNTEPFDVVLSQESLQYIHPLHWTMQRLFQLTKPGGRLVIGDQVLRAPEHRKHVQFHTSQDILAEAKAAGFVLVHHQDVTAMARHTVPVSLRLLRQLRPEILSFFATAHPDIEHHLDVCLHNGGIEAEWYLQGKIGYEHFAFDRPAAPPHA